MLRSMFCGGFLLLCGIGAAVAEPPLPGEDELALRKAFLVANACQVSYLTGEEIQATIRAMGIERHRFIDATLLGGRADTQVFLASTENYTLITFRGTQQAQDWMTNLSLEQAPFSIRGIAGHAHSGFLAGWREVRPAILEYLSEKPPHCHQVLLGGHSLGGALALLGGLELAGLGYSVRGVYTFGQPKVVSAQVEELYTNLQGMFPEIHRYVFESDPVPSIPPGYRHIGEERYSSSIGQILHSPRTGLFWPSVGDHSMENYLKTVSALMLTVDATEETRRMAAWLEERDRPLTTYLGVEQGEAVQRFEIFTEARPQAPCPGSGS